MKSLIKALNRIFCKTDIKGIEYEFDCECGKKISVWTNNYGQGITGKGSCECGAELYIN